MLEPLGDLQVTSWDVMCRLGVSYDNVFYCNMYHLKIVANNGSFDPLKYSMTDLMTQYLHENNPLFYPSHVHYQETQIKK